MAAGESRRVRMKLDGKTTVVTGAGRGIGRAIATYCAAAGADVVMAARSVDMLEDVAGEIRAGGGRALVVPTDVTDPAAVEQLVAATFDAFGRQTSWSTTAGSAGRPPSPGRPPSRNGGRRST
jgi:NAD(P)-dependent dehydrogenase (short-subunit alcohol dehydrogenase family)